MMKLLRRLLALLLATALSLTAAIWILSHTFGSPTYLEQRADSQNVYQHLADQLPGSPSAGLLRSQIQDFLPKLYTAIGGTDPGATITLPGSNTPITPVAPDSALAAMVKISGQLIWVGPAVCIVLILFIIAVGRSSRWKILSAAFLQAAIGLTLTAGILWLAPGFVMQNFVTAGLSLLKPALEPFISSLLHDVAWQFLLAAAGGVILAVLWRFLGLVLHFTNRFRKPQSPPPPPSGQPGFPGRLQD
ncbi:MAG: hypothetical protein NVSMB39_5820 [Candidatus Saccharimonadales bacterium]